MDNNTNKISFSNYDAILVVSFVFLAYFLVEYLLLRYYFRVIILDPLSVDYDQFYQLSTSYQFLVVFLIVMTPIFLFLFGYLIISTILLNEYYERIYTGHLVLNNHYCKEKKIYLDKIKRVYIDPEDPSVAPESWDLNIELINDKTIRAYYSGSKKAVQKRQNAIETLIQQYNDLMEKLS